VRALRENGVEFRDAKTGRLLIVHEGNPLRHRPVEEATETLRRDLEAIYELAASRGVKLVLLTYSAAPQTDRPGSMTFVPHYHMSEEMRALRERRGLKLVDVRGRFAELLANGVPRTQYFLTESDYHPNARGYAEIATLVADALEPAEAGRLRP
jgi:hypothetical protein